MYHEQSIYDDTEFNDPVTYPDPQNSQSNQSKGIQILTLLIVGIIIITATAGITYYIIKSRFEKISMASNNESKENEKK
jgi:flagellar basal body-associated protein FliL